ncbi:MAG: bile acid:sodium symporter family protein [Vulcanimicrobiaceae bacterium]
MAPQKLVALIMLVSLTFGAGLQVNIPNLVAVLKNVSLMARALIANFVIVPLLGWLAVFTFHLAEPVATGVLLMAIAPGVPFVLQSGARKQGGSLGFAVALAAILPALSVITIPITAGLMLTQAEKASLPLSNFIVSLAFFQLLPLVIGIAVSDRAPAFAAKLVRPMLLVFAITVVALLVLIAPKLVSDITSVYGSRGMVAMLCVVLLSLLTGYLLGGPERSYRRTLGIGTALRNIGLCALIATVSFKGGIVAATVMTYLLIQFTICGLAGAYFKRASKGETAGT